MKQILVCGYLGHENFGDEALLHILIKNLLECGIRRQDITVISNNSNATRNSHNVNSIGKLEALVALLNYDGLIFIGGLFQDKTSFQSFLYYFLLLLLGIIFQKSTVLWGAGIGPLQRKISQILLNWGLTKVHLLTLRDRASASLIPYGANIPVTCDPVWSIEPDYNFKKQIPQINWQAPVIGISLRSDKNLKMRHINDLATKVSKILLAKKEWQVMLIPCMPHEDLLALYAIDELLVKMTNDLSRIILVENFTHFPVSQQAGILASCDVMIGMRYHSLLVPLTAGKPVFGLIYDLKVRALLEFSGQVGVSFKDNFDQPWDYFWQNLEHSSQIAKETSQRAKLLHKKNIELLERLSNA